MKRLLAAAHPVEDLIAVAVGWLIFAFGESNVGLLGLTLIFMVAENIGCMIRAGIDPDLDFGIQDFVEFWLKKALLLMIPLVGAGVDIAWYLFSDPVAYLGTEIRRYTTKAMGLGVLAFQLREVLVLVTTVHKDLPFVKLLMRRLDKIMREDRDPPDHRWKREYDPPELKAASADESTDSNEHRDRSDDLGSRRHRV